VTLDCAVKGPDAKDDDEVISKLVFLKGAGGLPSDISTPVTGKLCT
jgi:hypothetical protein